MLSLLAAALPATAVQPVHGEGDKAPAMDGAHFYTGSVAGRVTLSNSTTGVEHAYVAIVNAANTTQAFYVGESDGDGYYHFTYINNTYAANSAAYVCSYKVYANHSLFGEGYSNSFPVEENSTAPANVIITPKPAKIVLSAERNNLVADEADHVKITAYVTDALGNPVGDLTPVDFWVNASPYDQSLNGSLSPTGYWAAPGLQHVEAVTRGGWANASFGWVNETAAGNSTTINASCTCDPGINASLSIYFNPTLASWFGSVQDSFGKPYGGTIVTLHLMGYVNGDQAQGVREIYNLTTTSYVDLPYPGSYLFDNVERNSSIAYGYVSAQADIGDGVIYYGASNNYTLNKSRTTSGDIVLHVPMPDGLKLTADPETLLVGGDQSIVTAQLYYNGRPYKRSGVTVNFFGDNDTVAFLPSLKTNVSDSEGRTSIVLTSNRTKGDVNVTGFTRIGLSRNLTDRATVHVVGWGTISGMVTDKYKGGIPLATVKLWTVKWANDTYENVELVRSPENPQQTISRPEIAAIGTYTFYRVPTGIYNVTAEKSDPAGNVHIWFAWVNLTAGTATNNIALPTIWHGSIAIATPPVVPSVSLLPTPPGVPSLLPSASTAAPPPVPGFEIVPALMGLLGVASVLKRH